MATIPHDSWFSNVSYTTIALVHGGVNRHRRVFCLIVQCDELNAARPEGHGIKIG